MMGRRAESNSSATRSSTASGGAKGVSLWRGAGSSGPSQMAVMTSFGRSKCTGPGLPPSATSNASCTTAWISSTLWIW